MKRFILSIAVASLVALPALVSAQPSDVRSLDQSTNPDILDDEQFALIQGQTQPAAPTRPDSGLNGAAPLSLAPTTSQRNPAFQPFDNVSPGISDFSLSNSDQDDSTVEDLASPGQTGDEQFGDFSD